MYAMDPATVLALAEINRRFYEGSAGDFDARRRYPWKGWRRLLAEVEARLPPESRERPRTILDAGCGNGRFGAFLVEHSSVPVLYLGLDGSLPLLALARSRLRPAVGKGRLQARWVRADLVRALVEEEPGGTGEEGALAPLASGRPRAALAVLLGVLHHIPGEAVRRRLLAGLADRLEPGGLLAISIWRYGEDPRFRRRMLPWERHGEALGVDPDRLEPGDHLLAWGAEPGRFRYCHHVDEAEQEALGRYLAKRGLKLAVTFDADGRDGDLNRYVVWRRAALEGARGAVKQRATEGEAPAFPGGSQEPSGAPISTVVEM